MVGESLDGAGGQVFVSQPIQVTHCNAISAPPGLSSL
jgi:hypothetical protein